MPNCFRFGVGGNRDIIFTTNLSRMGAARLGRLTSFRIGIHAPHSGFCRDLIGSTRRFCCRVSNRGCVLTNCP